MAKDNHRLQFIMDLVDKVSAPSEKVKKSLQGMGRDVNDTQKKMAALHKQAGDISKLAAMRGEIERGGKASSAQQREIDRLTRSLSKAGLDVNKLGDAERQTRIQIANTNTTLKQQQRELGIAADKQAKLTKAKEAYAKAEAQAGKMMGIGAKGMAAGAGMMAGTYAAGSKFTGYDHQLSAVQAVGRLTAEDKTRLSSVIEELASKSSFNANQAAGAAGFMAQAGFGKEEIASALGPVMQLAAATGSDLTRTADIASNIMGAFQIGADEMPRVADVLTMAANSFNVDLGMLGETMKYLAPVASKLGMSMEEATAMTGLLGNVGIQGSQAGNALKGMAGSLAAPNKRKSEALASIGMKDSDLKDANGDMLAIPDIMLKLQQKTKGMGNADLTALFKSMFGDEFYGPAMEIISKGGDVLENAVKSMYESQGAAAEAERIRLDNLEGDFTKFGSAAEGISIKLGKAMDPIYRKAMGFANGAMDKINAWMKENPKLVRQLGMVAGILGAVLTASSALLVGLGSLWLIMAKGRLTMKLLSWACGDWVKKLALGTAGLLKKVAAVTLFLAKGALQLTWWAVSRTAMLAWNVVCATVRLGMAALNIVMAANPIGLLIVAIGALVAAGVWLYQNWDKLPEIFSNLWSKVQEFLSFSPMEAITGAWDSVGAYFSDLFGGIWESFTGVFSKISDKMSFIGDAWKSVTGFWNGDDIPEAVKDAPKADSEPVVNGKPLVKGDQVKPAPAVHKQTDNHSYQITINAAGASAEEIGNMLDRRLAEEKRKQEQLNRARTKD